jgi:DNA polymerase-3 subunit gamma/tau
VEPAGKSAGRMAIREYSEYKKMSYLVFARKYRPQTFAEVVRQPHVTLTLANAIKAHRVAHAILFAGPRGTGKTTVARILAKAMNCEQGPAAEPCNKCQSCLEITAGNSADVFEIDGASNNSVDQIRELRENLKYMPVHSRYKIYIIDEVHMLSLAAFNALLKTLEEPPEHILFLFATTEPHKIPVTILSRCQRHDLRRIEGQAIAEHLRKICQAEEMAIDDASLQLIAQEAGGSMRDSLSLLDHILACAQGPVTVKMISELLGIVDRKHLFDLSDAVFERDIHKVLEIIDTVWRLGYELKRFYADLVTHFHHFILVKLGAQAQRLIDRPGEEIERMQDQVAHIPDTYLLQIFELLFQAEPAIKLSSQPKLGLEMVFLKLFQTSPALPIHTLIDRLERLQAGMGAPAGPARNAFGSDRPVPPAAPKASRDRIDSEKAAASQEGQEDQEIPATAAEEGGEPDGEPLNEARLWKGVLNQVSEEKPSLAGFLTKCALRLDPQGQLELEINGNEFTFKSVAKHREVLEVLCSRHLGRPVQLKLVANPEDAETKLEQKEKSGRLRQKAMSHPLVLEALELFEGRLTDIKVP